VPCVGLIVNDGQGPGPCRRPTPIEAHFSAAAQAWLRVRRSSGGVVGFANPDHISGPLGYRALRCRRSSQRDGFLALVLVENGTVLPRGGRTRQTDSVPILAINTGPYNGFLARKPYLHDSKRP